MKTSTISIWIAVVLSITGLTVVGSALFTIEQINSIDKSWENLESNIEVKDSILNSFRDADGLFAMVYDYQKFTNGDVSFRIPKFKRRISNTRSLLAAYEETVIDDNEFKAIGAIAATLDLYAENLDLYERMVADGSTQVEIIKAVRVDGKPAIESIVILSDYMNRARLESTASVHGSVAQIILLMKAALVVSVVMIFVLVAGVFRFLKSRTERNQALKDLAHQSVALQATLDNVDQGISFTDMDLNIVAFNLRFLELLDFPLDRFKSGDPFEYFIRYNAERGEYGPGDVESQVKERIDLAKQFKPHKIERSRPDGTVLEIQGIVVPDNQGFVTTYSDITERKHAELERLKANQHLEEQRRELKLMADKATEARDSALAANRSKSEFLTNMSHELRTPLNAVIGFSDMMRNELLGPISNPQYLSYANDIHDSGEHLLGLINDILDISKIEAGEMQLYEEPVSINKIINSCLTLVKNRANEGDVKLENHATDPLPMLIADTRKIKQIVINLLSNAVKFTQAGGTVTISATHDDDGSICILVKDTGIGIAARDIDKLLKPFTQADSTLTRKYEGTGLGLPLSKALIELHQGSFVLTSELGVGTEAKVHFPALRTVDDDDENGQIEVA